MKVIPNYKYTMHDHQKIYLVERGYSTFIKYILSKYSIDQSTWNYDDLLEYITSMTSTISTNDYMDFPLTPDAFNNYIPKTTGEIVMFIKDLCYELAYPIFDKPFIKCVYYLDDLINLSEEDQDADQMNGNYPRVEKLEILLDF